jgi:voltage-gated potassium channel
VNHPKNKTSLRRKWRATWRDSLLLLKDFGVPLALFGLLVVGGGLLYYGLALQAGEGPDNSVEAIYDTLAMVFLQGEGDFPHAAYLQVFYFFVPVIGIAILAQGLADFGILFFNRRTRSREWEAAVASTFSKHIVLAGLGHLGFRVVQKLHELDQEVVVIDLNPREDLVEAVRAMNLPVLHGDGTRETILEAAGVGRAKTIVLCTQNDSLNLQMAVKARSLNPDIHVIMRIFDDDFAQALEKQFGFSAMSATGMAAPIFAATAAGMDITAPITIEGQSLSLARLQVSPQSKLVKRCVSQVEQGYQLSVVLLRHADEDDFHPAGDRQLLAGDTLAVLGGPEQINRLAQDNR